MGVGRSGEWIAHHGGTVTGAAFACGLHVAGRCIQRAERVCQHR
jgi:hypothetical protein